MKLKKTISRAAAAAVCAASLTYADNVPALFAFDNGLTHTSGFEGKAALLKELGYDGIGWRPGRTAEMLKVLDKHGLKMGTIYVNRPVQAGKVAVDDTLDREFTALKGHGTIIWLGLLRAKGANDELAVKVLREVADKAAAADLPVVVYAHVGFYAEGVPHITKLVQEANRPNLGVSFNLCHFLKLDDEKNMEKVLRNAAPYLRLVQVSGADSGDTKRMGWDRLIQPLGKGSFDMSSLLKVLNDIGYDGPFCLQCYKVPGEDRVHLKQSMDTWKALHAERSRP